jgi:predicted amidohydrolase
MEVKAKKIKENRENLIKQCQKAITLGAQIVVGPEMCLSGYSFNSRTDIQNLVETENGPTAQAISKLALKNKVFIIVALAEKDSLTGIFYNSAFVFDQKGEVVCRYRKINAESRWACPGEANQNNVFETPWGKMGILICADSYHSLLPRTTILKGANLIFLPSNWPPLGHFPQQIWKMRSLENGVYLVAVNRTGIESNLDCQKAVSYVFDPSGKELLSYSGPEKIITVSLKLEKNGTLPSENREKIISQRKPHLYYHVCSNLNSLRNITSYLKLPDPGNLDIFALSPGKNNDPLKFFQHHLPMLTPGSLVLLPQYNYPKKHLALIQREAARGDFKVILSTPKAKEKVYHLLGLDCKTIKLTQNPQTDSIDIGPARIFLGQLSDMLQPELGIAVAKHGCDLALFCQEEISHKEEFMMSLRPIEQLAVAGCGMNLSFIKLIPSGHQIGSGARALAGEKCSYVLDTKTVRNKRFQDKINYELIF